MNHMAATISEISERAHFLRCINNASKGDYCGQDVTMEDVILHRQKYVQDRTP